MYNYKALKSSHGVIVLCLFRCKIMCKYKFICFLVFDSIKKKKKKNQRITIFSQLKNYDLFLEIIFHYFFGGK